MRALSVLLISLSFGAAQADEGLQRCAAIAADALRLQCFDQLAAQRKAAPAPSAVAPAVGAAPSPQAPVVKPQAATRQQDAVDAFGRQEKTTELPNGIERRVNGRFEGWDPNSIIELANGQQWRVVDGSSAVLSLDSPAIRIRRGVLGAFFMEVKGANQIARVRRVK